MQEGTFSSTAGRYHGTLRRTIPSQSSTGNLLIFAASVMWLTLSSSYSFITPFSSAFYRLSNVDCSPQPLEALSQLALLNIINHLSFNDDNATARPCESPQVVTLRSNQVKRCQQSYCCKGVSSSCGTTRTGSSCGPSFSATDECFASELEPTSLLLSAASSRCTLRRKKGTSTASATRLMANGTPKPTPNPISFALLPEPLDDEL